MKKIKVVKENPCDDCGIKGLYDNCKDECVQYRKYYQYQQGIADERPKAFAKGYEKGYQQGRADAIEELKPSADMVAYEQGRLDALDHCEKCETDQWDALYKAEMKGREKGIEEAIKTLAENEDTILTDKQYYTLQQLKEQKRC